MKKMIIIALFSTSLLAGGSSVSAYAQESEGNLGGTTGSVLPDEPNVPTDPTTPSEPEQPTEPSTPEQPAEPSTSTEPSEPSNPTEPSLPDEPSVPTDPTTPSEPEQPTEPTKPAEPSVPEKPVEPNKPTEPEKPVVPDKPVVPQQPERPTDVVVTPNGEIATGESTQQPTVPIETNNLSEVTHVPTVTTPIETASGEAIVAVDKGVPLTQTADGLKPIKSEYKVLPSGNVQVKSADGKMKVLPYTGEKMGIIGSIAGVCLTVLSGILFYKKRKV
ncbi:LPXTG cell wall anchor domain-containing protein [Enterococcus faecalis]|uniref:LPXTG cell wall anchor domain-containing protein n=1 Tax=Enterococcus faecalis TaxID=1351 RepID=UPI0015717BDB|nr:LPXTG cell wall anchor domain-containing protein [Enterococcus faecalis]EGO2593596.1 LPXTG cell wall anchor domain-containing protein [Enterococcus faecalis]EGO2604945.1 LPXTG cell wall anchor domain-containing protein [Enterococcus faecalis]EGO2620670.1 LPXTG cell wall anchor domain-containing protein [Enterococcus faecalis]EGO2675234.1 LPXTG cell wall anchor domain-containing protein [Enterococcus faecalis]EGO2720581.1 LPXTG cell wall anchor domain-containing protein [Enterococcus faecali